MRDEDIRSAVAARLAGARGPLPSWTLLRPARFAAGFAQAGASAVRRSLRRRFRRGDAGDVGPERAVVAGFGKLKGATMKLGQVLGYIDVGLPANLRAAFAALHTHAQPLPLEHVRAVLAADLGPAARTLTLAPEALSSASVGQVHRAALADGTLVVVKVLHPRLEKIMARGFLPALVTGRVARLIRPRGRLHAVVGEVRARVLEECDYALEAQRQQTFAELFADHPSIVVPEVLPELSSARVLTSRFADGVHLDAFLAGAPSQELRDRAGAALFDFYLGTLFRHGIYNCDPHPGNYLFMPDGRVAFVDFGSAREFPPGFVARLAALTDALVADDLARITEALRALGAVDERRPIDAQAARELLRALYGPLLHDAATTFDVSELKLLALVRRFRRARLVSSGELVFLLRAILGLASVLARLGARANWQRRLREDDARELPRDQPLPLTIVPREDDGQYDVVLVDAGESLIAVVREVRELTGLDLRDVELLIGDAPRAIKEALPKAEAEALRERLESAGARVRLARRGRS